MIREARSFGEFPAYSAIRVPGLENAWLFALSEENREGGIVVNSFVITTEGRAKPAGRLDAPGEVKEIMLAPDGLGLFVFHENQKDPLRPSATLYRLDEIEED